MRTWWRERDRRRYVVVLFGLTEERPPADNVGRLFERFLQRKPSADEISMAKDLVATRGRQGYEDLQWLLVNKVEFVFNY